MALTDLQKSHLYEILELFQGGTFDVIDYNDRITGVITSLAIRSQVDFTVATNRLEEILTAIAGGADGTAREESLIEAITRYEDCGVRFDTTRISVGGVSGAQGARFDPDEARDRIRMVVESILGFTVRKIGDFYGDLQYNGNTIRR